MVTIFNEQNKNLLLDTDNNQITFLDSRFYKTETGAFVPSVTTILDAYPKGSAFYDWLKKHGEDSDNIRDEAGRRGSTVHELTELYDQGVEVSLMDANGFIGYKLLEWAMFERYVEFRNRYEFDILHSELNIVSEKLGHAGTLDRVVKMNGKKILLDIKTSGSIWDSFWAQVAAYRELLQVETGLSVDGVAILWLNAKTKSYGTKDAIQGPGWQMLSREDTTNDLSLFKATKALWGAQNEGMKPKQISYSLTHKLNQNGSSRI